MTKTGVLHSPTPIFSSSVGIHIIGYFPSGRASHIMSISWDDAAGNTRAGEAASGSLAAPSAGLHVSRRFEDVREGTIRNKM